MRSLYLTLTTSALVLLFSATAHAMQLKYPFGRIAAQLEGDELGKQQNGKGKAVGRIADEVATSALSGNPWEAKYTLEDVMKIVNRIEQDEERAKRRQKKHVPPPPRPAKGNQGARRQQVGKAKKQKDKKLKQQRKKSPDSSDSSDEEE
jgi:hypothetical protein